MTKKFSYTIYQCPATVRYCFRDYQDDNFDIYDYVAVWRGDDVINFKDNSTNYGELLELLFTKFNIEKSDRLTNYAGRPMSVSDVICLEIDGQILWYYCNGFGFKQLTDEKVRN